MQSVSTEEEWVPAFAEKHPSPWTERLGGTTEGRSVLAGACVRNIDNGTRRWYKMNIKEHRTARVNSENRSAEILKEIDAPGSTR